MDRKPAKIIVTIAKKAVYQIKEMLFYKKLDWECISKPLEEDPAALQIGLLKTLSLKLRTR